ncbi:substrate-binding protein [Vibrio sp. CAU 1672]|uniref:substrate-binding protein n=1 Tax=Vibrio sp. CAU 1672 TaxID=3032594 RepID=UPI0023D99992|nr:substrate-binding protein [Vibrio sp. CAU 1672]MDF2153073.1 substrate-binding protein [Vibrio sp. CAU 1672]
MLRFIGKNTLLLAVVVPIIVLVSGCSPLQPSIKIGVVLPLTGSYAIYGQQALHGAELAVDQINQSGGILGRKLELVIRDNQTDPAKTVKYSRELINQQVFALIGPVSSASRYAMTEIAEEFKTPLFYGMDYEGRHFNRYLICYSAIPEHYIDPLIPYLIDNVGNSFYIYGYDYIWPHRMSKRIIESVNQHQGRITNTEFTAFGTTNFSPVFERIKRSGAKTLMLFLPGTEGFTFLTEMRQYDFGRSVQVVAFAADETYLPNLAAENLEGILTALHFFNHLQDQPSKQFVRDYQQMHGADAIATYASKAHYDLIYVLKSGLESAGEVDREAMIDALPGLTLYQGAKAITLRADHHFNLPMYLARFHAGSLQTVKELGTIIPGDQRSRTDE